MYFFREKSATMTSLYTMLVTKAYGQESKAAKDAKTACWKIVTTLLRVMFHELHGVRVFAENGYLRAGEENAYYLHGVLQAHMIMPEFAKNKFIEHPRFYPKLLMHLFGSSAPQVDVVELAKTNSDLQKQVKDLQKEIHTCKSIVDGLVRKRNNGPQGSHGGHGGGKNSANGGGNAPMDQN